RSIGVWISVFICFIDVFLSFLVFPFGLCLSFAICSRKFGAKFLKNFFKSVECFSRELSTSRVGSERVSPSSDLGCLLNQKRRRADRSPPLKEALKWLTRGLPRALLRMRPSRV